MTGLLTYLRSIRQLSTSSESHGVLLQRFRVQRDEQAFATLVQRHGPLVLGMARRAVADVNLADDIFQATFLVLARRGKQMETWPSVAGWLVQVVRRTAMQAKAKAARRQRHEQLVMPMNSHRDPSEVAEQRELAGLVDSELARLPSKYRTPLVLCQLQGNTKEETAQLLGWPVGSVSGRLARGKKMLAARLLRRGVVPSLLAGLMTLPRVEAQLSPLLVQATTLHASQIAHRTAAVSKCTALTLAQGVLTTMWIGKVKTVAVATLLVGMLAASGVWAWTEVSNAQPAFAVSIQTKPGERGNTELAALNGSWIIEETKAGTNTAWVGGPRAVNERHYWLFDRDQFQVRATYFSSEMQLYIDKPVFFDSRQPHRRFQLDTSTNPCRILIEPKNKNDALIKGIIKIENDQLLIHFVYDADKDYPADFQLTPHSVLLKMRRATDYDRLEGIWRLEEFNPVTGEMQSATELIFKKQMYVQRNYQMNAGNGGICQEEEPRQYSLREGAPIKEIDLDIASQKQIDSYTRMWSELNRSESEWSEYAKKNRIVERRVGIYTLNSQEFKYGISGSIPLRMKSGKLETDVQSSLNVRASSWQLPGLTVMEFKRQPQPLKDLAGRFVLAANNSTTTPSPQPNSITKDVRRLQEQRLQLAEERLALWKQAYSSGAASFEQQLPIAEQVLDARLAITTNKEEKLKAMQTHLETLRKLEQAADAKYRDGGVTRSGLLDLQLKRIEFEIRYEEMQGK